MEKVLAGTLTLVTCGMLLVSMVLVFVMVIPEEEHVVTWAATVVTMLAAIFGVVYKSFRPSRS
ncbi:MAG: hypothetical protein IKE34_04520 [Paenibacillus sp.]|uniref:hypothetical protein n=1 Tax=Paenibacillus aquistagni TaxID=1852522 RepID=UPI00145AF10D|nr:hypothetical protein [Paenibacillus aquistagni]MBR2568432.1 hypothetical protein [Paenibacillus sp.]NMM52377.1 hypothetical protein [Paenibacillus aquistagni]